MAKVELKAPVVEEISKKIDGAASVVLVDHRGLTVAEDTELRKLLREAGVDYKVYKNTMMKRAFEGTPFAGLDDLLNGPSAMAVAKDDATAPARILAEFAKKAKNLEIKGGVVEGDVYDAAGIGQIATVPTREVLLGRLFGSWQSPIASFARVIKQIAEKDGEGAAPAEEAPAAE
ncbi:MAG: 50S ribosomal protein L10 [Lachnospiraceae bacterium]|jgi:large subunit ribosomal protein L10|nr:50S ribosomal protein L10 [Lachnospiraceae bacterium]